MKTGLVEECGICGSDELNLILNMGEQPLAERFGDDRVYPLGLLRCRSCGLVQLSYIVDPELVFPPEHPYATGNTRALREHFSALAWKVSPELAPGDLVVDIGANDGTFLGMLDPSLRRLAVEPTNQIVKARKNGLMTWQEFFTGDLAAAIFDDLGPAKLVTASNVLAHVPDPHDFVEGVMTLLDDEGIFITENGALDGITDGLQIDSIYHEHLRYYSVASMSRLLDMHGMQVNGAEFYPLHGGIYRIAATRRAPDFPILAFRTASMVHRMLRSITEDGGTVYGIGAATRATSLIHFTGIARDIDRVCEITGSEKIGRTVPGTAIPIVDEAELLENQPSYALLFAWQIADDLISGLRKRGYLGDFIIPLPEPRIIRGQD